MNLKNLIVVASALGASAVSAADIYVSLGTGKNKDALKLFGAMNGKGAQDVK